MTNAKMTLNKRSGKLDCTLSLDSKFADAEDGDGNAEVSSPFPTGTFEDVKV